MGLLEDAIAAFQLAMLAPGRELASLHMMGLCALELGRGADAVAHLEQALSLPDLPEDKRIPLRYDAGRAYGSAGDIARSRAAFEEVRAADPGFGDVESELAALDTLRSEEPETGEQSGDETFASFDDQLAEPARVTAEAPRYESFEDLFRDESEEAVASAPSATLDAAESEPVPAEPEPAAEPEPEPEPDPVPAEPVAPKRRRKISFV
jgi:tetratricopeptide (TPR) repeat protein